MADGSKLESKLYYNDTCNDRTDSNINCEKMTQTFSILLLLTRSCQKNVSISCPKKVWNGIESN